MFNGFGDGAIEFFEGLCADNSKAYWFEHRALYRAAVRTPMEALLAELEPEFAPGFGVGKVFRPYRDLRFARDKAPYKTHCGAVIEPGRGGGAFYVEISADGMLTAGGCFATAPDQVARYRAAVGDPVHGATLEEVLQDLAARGWQRAGTRLRTRPRGVPADHEHLDLLRHRTLYVQRRYPPDDTLHERGALDRVRADWAQVRALNDWFRQHVGVSETTGRHQR